MGSAASQRTASSSRASEKVLTSPPINIKALRKVDLTNAEEFFKLKGAVLDEHLLRLILKSFTSKSETRVQEERMQSESALNAKQKTIDDIVSAEIESLQKQLMQEKQKVLNAEDDLTMAIDCAINSDEQAQILVLRKEIHELKSRLETVTAELEESKKKKAEEETKKVEESKKLEEASDSGKTTATKAEERIERLQ